MTRATLYILAAVLLLSRSTTQEQTECTDNGQTAAPEIHCYAPGHE